MKIITPRFISALLLVSLFVSGQSTRPAYAAGYVVNSLGDSVANDGVCTLREAIQEANNGTDTDCAGTPSAGDDTIVFSVSGTITLGSILPSIVGGQGNLTIDGGGIITISGGLATSLFYVPAPASLTLNGITLDSAYSANSSGGAIQASGTLSLSNVTISHSQTSNLYCGGAIWTSGVASIVNSRFRNNTAGQGGAICTGVFGTARLHITNSEFVLNRAVNSNFAPGGAIWMQSGELVFNSTDGSNPAGLMLNNSAQFGGAIYLDQAAVATLSGLWLNGNSASSDGGAIYNKAGILNIARTTFSTNSTPMSVIGVGYGGAIANLGMMTLVNSRLNTNQGRFGGAVFVGGNLTSARATIDHVTFSQNTAGQSGGGLYTNVDTTVVTVTDSVFNLNTANGVGGGIARFNARLTVLRSSFTRNTGALGGGGLFVSAGPNGTEGGYVEIHDATLSTNTASNGQGGGLYNAALTNLQGVTIKDNSSGIFTFRPSGSKVTRMNDTVLQNPNGLNCDGDGTLPTSAGGNFSTDNSCGLTGSGDRQGIGLDPKLGALMQDPLGITYYHMPQTGSPLINAAVPPCSPRDQRGALRLDACDIGAAEYGGLVPLLYLPLIVR
ncbi:MAG TPA: choice-of-anchor Q domain-containing protein [Thermoflexus sp.]|nr:choice-of-anchor Q domain-containing protein [Thermoflexus sp.]